MSILNYTTQISPSKSTGEIQELLGSKGAQSVSVQYESGEPSAIFFALEVGDTVVNFRLPSNWRGVLTILNADPKVSIKLKSNDQAKRVAWRIVKAWVQAQLAIIESGQAKMAEVFLPYALNSNGQTCFERLEKSPQLLLGME